MNIQISIQRPVLTLLSVLVVGGLISTHLPTMNANQISAEGTVTAAGGTTNAADIIDARSNVQSDRIKQQVLANEESIWRYQVEQLSATVEAGANPETADQLKQSRAVLLSIIRQKQQAEEMLKQSIDQLLQVEGTAVAPDSVTPNAFTFDVWPVQPKYGISAYFQDPDYKSHFHLDHHAIDIPTEQGTEVVAPADGTVEKYADNGLGYSYLVLRHNDHIETIYGHITAALVKEGDTVKAGQAIALSGGRIGSKGAGSLTTGPHLHFGMKIDGQLSDPLPHLSQRGIGQPTLSRSSGSAEPVNVPSNGSAQEDWPYQWK